MRSKLFLAGDKADQFAEYLATGADVVSLDLEDTVTPERKTVARDKVLALVRGLPPSTMKRVLVRVNSLESGLIEEDLAALAGSGVRLINLPKPESADDVREVTGIIDRLEDAIGVPPERRMRLLLNIESPRGLRKAYDIAAASDRVSALQIGYADLLEPYGIDREYAAALDFIRSSVRMVAAELGLEVYDGVYAGLDNDDFFRQEAIDAKRLGFAGKSCFNAEQVAIVNSVFDPTPAERARAQRVVDTAELAFARGDGIYLLDGRVVDAPFVEGARQLLRRAGELDRLKAETQEPGLR